MIREWVVTKEAFRRGDRLLPVSSLIMNHFHSVPPTPLFLNILDGSFFSVGILFFMLGFKQHLARWREGAIQG